MSTTEPVLSISGLAVAFRTGSELVTAVSDVTIDIAAGETVAVVGSRGRASRPLRPRSTVCCRRTA